MKDLTLIERIKSIFSLIKSSPFFIALLSITILTIILLVLNQKFKKTIFKIILALIYIGLTIFIFIKYGTYILKAGDSIIDQLFTAIYFPSITAYISMLAITLILMLISIFYKKISKIFRFCNACMFTLLTFFSILIIDTIIKNNIDISKKISMYSNTSLTILIQASMSIFTIWIFVLIINIIVNFISNKIDQSVQKANEGIKLEEDDFKPIDDQVFDQSFNKYIDNKNQEVIDKSDLNYKKADNKQDEVEEL